MNRFDSLKNNLKIRWLATPVLILVSAFVTNAIIMLLCHYNPLEAYQAAVSGAFGNGRKFGETLVKSTPFLMTGLSVAMAFRCGIWNIGAEGQFLIGALAATWFGTKLAPIFPQHPWIAVPLCLGLAMLAGGIWGLIPAILKVARGVNEVISTIMLNYVALHLVSMMIDGGPLQETAQRGPQSDRIVQWVFLPRIFPPHRVHLGIVMAVVLAISPHIYSLSDGVWISTPRSRRGSGCSRNGGDLDCAEHAPCLFYQWRTRRTRWGN